MKDTPENKIITPIVYKTFTEEEQEKFGYNMYTSSDGMRYMGKHNSEMFLYHLEKMFNKEHGKIESEPKKG